MAENRCGCNTGAANNALCGLATSSGTVCIDTYRVLDSCRDRDCYEDVLIFVTAEGQQVVNTSCNIRVSGTELIWANVVLNEIAFNDGFYQIDIKYYVKLRLEGCSGTSRGIPFEGLAVLQKTVILYGGQGNTSVFRSGDNNFCTVPDCTLPTPMQPIAIVEAVEPIALSSRIVDCNCECGYSCCTCSELPAELNCYFASPLQPLSDTFNLYISLGLFSVIRIVRPAQILVNGTDYSVPDKECVAAEQDDPCRLFHSLAFPVSQFTGNHICTTEQGNTSNTQRGCCGNGK